MKNTEIAHDDDKISVVGLGYVGLPLALLTDKKGYRVFGIDKDQTRVDIINGKKCPFINDEKINKELKVSHLTATTDFAVVEQSSIVIICVPTPVYDNYLPNLEPVKGASRSVGIHLKKGMLVILESTVNPGVCEEVVLPILEKASRLICGKDFYLAHCPERINPGDSQWGVSNIPRVVGSLDHAGLQKTLSFYRSIIDAEIKPMGSLKEAEAVKIVENSFRDINIAFVNELAKSFSQLGIDVVNVINGAATKPFAFMPHFPGCGVGGHCIPVDPYYLIEYAKQNGFNHKFLTIARQVNNSMPIFTVQRIKEGLKEIKKPLKGSKVTVLGLAYKADIGDCRESPAFEIIENLKKHGVKVTAFDPYVLEKSSVNSLNDALRGADAVVITTAHTIFKSLKPDALRLAGSKVIVDGRNCLDKQLFVQNGMVYKGIGR